MGEKNARGIINAHVKQVVHGMVRAFGGMSLTYVLFIVGAVFNAA